ncbi:DUF3817 domain-containing protein [Acinetobacter oleivorans]|jgi:integral membrane protein|uniref:DUF3817 domain-containing protein n=1 Tax=Acinetobacter oleivorans (strain JCM 16667 / KCTC 23045 / DR1) TaxID=436717 RepID=A0AAN0P5D8_ACISD|nr:DUF3817 domain-containing protein [Acinetobacter oleivorans]ADI89169.1 hypothetical protein AOLE_01330 [Acinetobacter oleivorans DR1]ESK42590.1 hypothetical protein P254_03425 [Acinetobacter oleivorans CIP 110421]WQF73225.1 DUF3817 domain-containing protein [Acinetobacter oleivorans]
MANPKAHNITQFQKLKFFSLLETVSLLLLVAIAVPLKYFNGWDTGVHFMGPIHGLTFFTYIWFAVQTIADSKWTPLEILRLVVITLIPFGVYFNLSFIKNKIAKLDETQSS